MTIGTTAGDAPGAAATSDTDPGAPRTSAGPGSQRAPETLGPTVDTDRAEAMKMTIGTEVLPATTRGLTMNRAQEAALGPPPPPDPGPKVKRASRGPTARPKTSIRAAAPRNSLWADLRHAPTPDPCPGHALAPGPGPDASLGDTDCLFPRRLWFWSLGVFLFSF